MLQIYSLYLKAVRSVLKFPWIYMSSLLCFLLLYIRILKSQRQKLSWFYVHFHSWSFRLTSVMIGPAKLANKTCAASVARMNSANKTSTGSKQAMPSEAILILFELLYGKQVWNCLLFNDRHEWSLNFPFIVKKSSNEKKMKKQHKVFSIDYRQRIYWWTLLEGKGSTCSCLSRYWQFLGFKRLDWLF